MKFRKNVLLPLCLIMAFGGGCVSSKDAFWYIPDDGTHASEERDRLMELRKAETEQIEVEEKARIVAEKEHASQLKEQEEADAKAARVAEKSRKKEAAALARKEKEALRKKEGGSSGFFGFFAKKDKPAEPEVPRTSNPQPNPEPNPTQPLTINAMDYVLKPLDPIVIKLSGPTDLANVEDYLDAEGDINLKYIPDPVRASGKTGTQLERHIKNLYEDVHKIYRKNQITVTVLIPSKNYTVSGEVNRQGQYALSAGITLSRAISIAGGFSQWAKKSKIVVQRNDGSQEVCNFDRIKDNKEEDLLLRSGDIIFVDKARF
jgi:polysaccharide export outer membrane protein